MNVPPAIQPGELAVIIVNYNTQAMLRVCLSSVFAQECENLQVLVVDNASSDGSPDAVRREFTGVKLLAQDKNLGFAAGNNIALHALGFEAPEAPSSVSNIPEFVVFLNPDTEVQPGALATMLSFMHDTPDAGVAGASLVYPDGVFQHSAFHFPTLWQIWFDFFSWPGRFVDSRFNGRYARSLYEADRPFTIDHPLGACMFTRASVINQVGLMDERFFMYAEEIDWCMRVKAAGWENYCVPSAKIVHHAGGSTRHYRHQMNAALWDSRFRLFRKHYSPVFVLVARLLARVGQWSLSRREVQAGKN